MYFSRSHSPRGHYVSEDFYRLEGRREKHVKKTQQTSQILQIKKCNQVWFFFSRCESGLLFSAGSPSKDVKTCDLHDAFASLPIV